MAASDRPASVVRAIGIVVAVLLVAELVAQLIVYGFAHDRFRSLALYRWSPYGLVRNNPELSSPDFVINANGFRATRDFSRAKGKRTFRVMLMGGSVLYSGLGGPARVERLGRVHSSKTIAPYLEARLRADPAFGGVDVEVINAAVNFNRITEVSSAYLEEYIHWQPDVVVVFGSVNNFSELRTAGALARFETSLQRPHPWRAEFERLVNNNSAQSAVEHLWRTGGEHSAALALATKVSQVIADRWVALTAALAPAKVPPPVALETPAETRAYFDLFAIYASAMAGAAEQSGSKIIFAWEPMLSDIGDTKALTADEAAIYPAVKRPADQIAQYDRARQLSAAWAAQRGVAFFDPTNAVIAHPGSVFIDYGHYTPDGNRFIADTLYAQYREPFAAAAARTTMAPPK